MEERAGWLAKSDRLAALIRRSLVPTIQAGRDDGLTDDEMRIYAFRALRKTTRFLPLSDRDMEVYAATARRVIDEMLPEGAAR